MKTILTVYLFSGCVLASAAFAAEEAPIDPDAHMRGMREQMAAIRAEQDPARRAELMQEHHAMMRRGMNMSAPDDTAGMTMEQRMTRMEQRGEMMQMMMEHMMEGHAPAADDTDAAAGQEHQHTQ